MGISKMRRCATCWKDPATKSWRNPNNVKFGGTAESNWICERCKKAPANWPWAATPRQEVYGLERDDGDDVMPEPDRVPGQYETKLCIEIMKRHVLGQSQVETARELNTSRSFVQRTIYFWRSNYGGFLENLIDKMSKLH